MGSILLETIIPIFGIIAIGWALGRTKVITRAGVKVLTDYVYYVGFPALVFMSLRKVDLASLLNPRLYFVNFAGIFIMMGIAYAVAVAFKLEGGLRAVFILCAFSGNVAYMGFPLNRLALGEGAMPYASLTVAIYFIATMTFGVLMLGRYSGSRTSVATWIWKVPLIWGLILGLIYSWARLPLPFPQLWAMIADSASPVALIAMGAFLCGTRLGESRTWIALVTFLKLILHPLLVLLISMPLNFTGLAFKSSILQASTPVAVFMFILAHQFGVESDFAADAIVTTTLASVATLSLLLHLIV